MKKVILIDEDMASTLITRFNDAGYTVRVASEDDADFTQLKSHPDVVISKQPKLDTLGKRPQIH